MKRLLNPFVVAITAILAAGYGYLAWRLTAGAVARLALAVPFVMICAMDRAFRGSRPARSPQRVRHARSSVDAIMIDSAGMSSMTDRLSKHDAMFGSGSGGVACHAGERSRRTGGQKPQRASGHDLLEVRFRG